MFIISCKRSRGSISEAQRKLAQCPLQCKLLYAAFTITVADDKMLSNDAPGLSAQVIASGGILMSNFEKKFGRFAISNLSLKLVVLYLVGYVLYYVKPEIFSLLVLDVTALLHGQFWRILSWLLVPPMGGGNFFFIAIMLYFYYSIGTSLERVWGDYKYNVYLPTPFYTNLLSSATERLQQKYRWNFHQDMMTSLPRFAITGFDHAYFFLLGLHKYGKTFDGAAGRFGYQPVQTPLKFERVGNGGYKNKAFMFVHYLPEHKIEAVNY